MAELDGRLAGYEAVLARSWAVNTALLNLTFWQRLTWLVTGSIHGLS
jgi:hypothetical protein